MLISIIIIIIIMTIIIMIVSDPGQVAQDHHEPAGERHVRHVHALGGTHLWGIRFYKGFAFIRNLPLQGGRWLLKSGS